MNNQPSRSERRSYPLGAQEPVGRRKTTRSKKIPIGMVLIILVSLTFVLAQLPPNQMPPQEPIDACVEKSNGDFCNFVRIDEKNIVGICSSLPDGKIVCVPDGEEPAPKDVSPSEGKELGKESKDFFSKLFNFLFGWMKSEGLSEQEDPIPEQKEKKVPDDKIITEDSGKEILARSENKVADTGQVDCYSANSKINCPTEDSSFYGQDAQYSGAQPFYKNNGDDTITDLNTGLMWQKGFEGKQGYYDADESFSLAEYDDWRIPTIKELYSLMDFRGVDINPQGIDTAYAIPFIDTDYFDFAYGDTARGDRIIDSQWITTNVYVAGVMDNEECFFGVNFADGRIKCYPTSSPMNNGYYLRYVRGEEYGKNDFIDNGDTTITDRSSGLMWQQIDSEEGFDWENALGYCEHLVLGGHDSGEPDFVGYTDWRLPNIKELQYIVDYTRSPDTTGSAAIDSVFEISEITNEANKKDYPFFWSGTTHLSEMVGSEAGAYISFGRAMGYMNGAWKDVHGAGSQRSDPKSGDPNNFPEGRGPQGDAIRIYNYARCIRG